MGVMAFAAENYEPEQETYKYYRIAIPNERNGISYTTYLEITIDGGYSEVDDYSWVSVRNIAYDGPRADLFWNVQPIYSDDYSTVTVDVFYEDDTPANGDDFHCYHLTVSLSSTGYWTATGFYYIGSTLYGPIIIDN